MQPSSTIQDPDELASMEQRRHQRYSVRIAVVLHAHGKTQPTITNNLSTGGVGIEGVIGIYSDDIVEFGLKGMRRIPGTVIWWISGRCGVQFDEALNRNDPLLVAASAQVRE
jgi:hypothetical protein